MNDVWVLIPARGGSKGIPGKNMRPLGGAPLISHTLTTARSLLAEDRVLVSTDDHGIERYCRDKARVLHRPPELATDESTLDEVSVEVARMLVKEGASAGDLLLTVQPTSPFLKAPSLWRAVDELRAGAGSVLTVVDDRHLRWTVENGGAKPLFAERVNRQWLAPQLAETGGIIGARLGAIIDQGTRIVEPVRLLEVDAVEGLDIDDFADWAVAEYYASRRTVVIRADAGRALGMGHAYRSLALQHELAQHDVRLVTGSGDGRELGEEFFRQRLGRVEVVQSDEEFLALLENVQPDITVLDVLDTSEEYVAAVRQRSHFAVSIEDMGPGSRLADLVINDLYTDPYPSANHRYGVRYAILGPQFEGVEPIARPAGPVNRLLVTFGGTDPGCLTEKTLQALSRAAVEAVVVVVLGPGYAHGPVALEEYGLHGEVLNCVTNLAVVMHECDLAITSGGRTVTELMTQGVPTITLCQNQREMMHSHASSPFGVANLGLGEYIEPTALARYISLLVADVDMRASMHERMLKAIQERSNRSIAEMILSAAEEARDQHAE